MRIIPSKRRNLKKFVKKIKIRFRKLLRKLNIHQFKELLFKFPKYGRICFFLYFSFQDRLNKDSRIIIYQMGKVGSVTLQKSLQKLGIICYRIHKIVETPPLIFRDDRKSKSNLEQIWMVLFLRKKLEKGINPKKWKIITAVREPVARNISAFFQNQVQYKHMGKMTLKNLLDLFLAENWNYNVLNWFDRELKQVFGIDVYSEPFPTTKGYKIYKVKDQPDLLLLRLENLDNCAQAAFQEFLNIEQFTLAPENIARNKFYYPIYRKFTTSKILPRAYIEKMYTSRLAKHFYTEDELNTFRKKWLKEPN